MDYLFLLVIISMVLMLASYQIPPGPPSIDGPPVIVVNSQITLTCTSARGDPPPTVKFLKDDQEITTGISTTTAGTAVTTSLTFIATLDYHFEVLECQAENGVLQNPLSTTKFIEVHFSPDQPTLTGPTTSTPGQTGTWTCSSANGFPGGLMTMRNANKNTQFTSEFATYTVLDIKSYDVTGTLTWSPVMANNGETICCDVTHTTTLGSTPQTVCRQITVAQPIAINAPVTQYSPIRQSSVTLQCAVTQGTASQIMWIKDNVQLNINTTSRLTGGTVATESLTITNVQQSDAGNYVCRGIDAVTGNIVNTDTINVNPVGTPSVTFISQSSYTQRVGQQIVLMCTVQSPNSVLREVQWTFTNNEGQTTDPIPVSTSNGKYSGSSVNSPSLTIQNVASTDQGTYSCKARNMIGTSTNNSTSTLTVTGNEDEDNIIVYAVIGILATLVLFVLLGVMIRYRIGREKGKDNANNKYVSQQAAFSNQQDNADYSTHRNRVRDYEGLDSNRREMHVYNTPQDNEEYSTIPADHVFVDPNHTNLKRDNTYLEPNHSNLKQDHTILKPDNNYLEPGHSIVTPNNVSLKLGHIYFQPISGKSMTSTT